MAFTSLAAGVSGLQSFSEAVGVIADNITNVNTIGYKESRSRFSTLVTETAAISSYSPGGVKSTTETLISKQGLLQPSASSTDLSVDGNGFFVVREEADNSSEVLFTRSGNFTQDSAGYLRNTSGLYLMGWVLDENGDVPVNSSQQSQLVPINYSSQNGEAESTKNVALRANFTAAPEVNPDAATYTVGQLATGAVSVEPNEFEEDITIYDRQGNTSVLKVAAIKTGVNEWQVEIYADDPTLMDGTAHPNGVVANGTLLFDGDGNLDITNSTLFQGATQTTPIDLLTGSATIAFDSAANVGSGDLNIRFDFGDGTASNGINQKGTDTGLISKSVDGADFGDVVGVSINENGDVTTLFDSGQSLTRYRIPVATFNNADGLLRRQGNAFGQSDVSGVPGFKVPGSDGAGKVSSNTLELSTVDLASEFAELIKVQRAFSASTRIITTSDQILEELTRL